MKAKYYYLVSLFLCLQLGFSQVGINTPSPASTLDVVATNPTGITTNVDGILIPRVTRQRAQSMTSVPTSTLIYINEAVTGTAAGTTINVSNAGFYIYNGSNWESMTGGQNSSSFFTTASLSVTTATGLTFLPGFPVTITVPANCVVNLASDCGFATTSVATSGFSLVDFALIVDGATLTDAGYQRATAQNNAGLTGAFEYASMSQTVALTAGSHTFGVAVAGTGIGSTATVGGNSTSVLQGELTVTILKK